MEKRLLSVEETATYLSLSPRTIYNGISRKSKKPFPVKVKRYGRKPLFDIRDLDKWVNSLDTASSGNNENANEIKQS